MTAKNVRLSWAIFSLLSVSTISVYQFGWATDQYQLYLGALGIASLIAAIWLLFCTRLNRLSVVLVLKGLLAGQWWFIQDILTKASWLIKGFV